MDTIAHLQKKLLQKKPNIQYNKSSEFKMTHQALTLALFERILFAVPDVCVVASFFRMTDGDHLSNNDRVWWVKK